VSEMASPNLIKPVRSLNVGAWTEVKTNFGMFHVACVDGAIVQTALPGTETGHFLEDIAARFPGVQFQQTQSDPTIARAAAQIVEYTQGKRTRFDVPVRPEGTAFQQKVWDALARIPYGQAKSYHEIAQEIGRPGASRAVGQANHNNPVAPFIPCHRVIAAGGGLGGYGGGLELKRRMLEMEGVQVG
jgi:methylated-DNA-[protein]-cysteine S-methyltransferase